MKLFEPTVTVPPREPPGLASTLTPIVPLPGPLPPEVILIQEALLVAVQLHVAAVDTLTESVYAVLGA